MYILKIKIKTTSKFLLNEGCPEWTKITIGEFETIKDAAKICKEKNDHIKKFHKDKIGKEIYYIREV